MYICENGHEFEQPAQVNFDGFLENVCPECEVREFEENTALTPGEALDELRGRETCEMNERRER